MIRSFMAAQHLLLIGKLDLDLVAVRFGDWRIRLLHDLLGLLIGFLQKFALGSLVGRRFLGMFQRFGSVRYLIAIEQRALRVEEAQRVRIHDTDCNVALGKVIEIVRVSSCTLISALARSTPARIS